MKNKEAVDLLNKYQQGTITEQELAILEGWYNHKAGLGRVEITDQELDSNLNDIWARLPAGRSKVSRLWAKVAVAAAVATVIFGAGLFYFSKEKANTEQVAYANDVGPGKIGATLTLASGEKIRLSGAANGELAKQTGVVISKTADGQIVYQVVSSADGSAKMNTLSTSNGETYKVILPDGTEVWLNAASKLTYPTSFASQSHRRVNLSGEGYFEVAKDKTHPFIVETTGHEVEVLGTHFNISSYTDESVVTTTLLEGSVKVKDRVLKPGQASLVTGNNIKVQEVDTELATAWKNGAFMFDEEPLSSIMRKVARWYNVEVVYADGVNKEALFGGGVSRYDNISKVLENLELTKNIHFKIEGRRITVNK